jgi:hypothetical protein
MNKTKVREMLAVPVTQVILEKDMVQWILMNKKILLVKLERKIHRLERRKKMNQEEKTKDALATRAADRMRTGVTVAGVVTIAKKL